MTPYRILVTGSRDWNDVPLVRQAIAGTASCFPGHVVIVHGACPTGADLIASTWAREMGAGLDVSEEGHPAQGHPTEDFGPWPGAGPRRNAHMVRLGADACLAFIGPCTSPRCRRPDPHPSHGASHCARLAEKAGIPTRRWTA